MVTVGGELDVHTAPTLQAALGALDSSGRIVVDLTDVTTIDVTALKVLAVATRRASRDGHHLMLRGCGPAVRRMLHLSRLIRVVEVERAAASA